MTDTLQTAITKFATLLTDQSGITSLKEAGLHDDSLANYHTNGFAETEFRESLACFILTTLFTKFQEIVVPAIKAEAEGSLIKDEGNDASAYTLREGADGAWIRIKNIDVRVHDADESVCADLYPALSPNVEALASTWLTFAECESEDNIRNQAK